jgi:hypothetical protein
MKARVTDSLLMPETSHGETLLLLGACEKCVCARMSFPLSAGMRSSSTNQGPFKARPDQNERMNTSAVGSHTKRASSNCDFATVLTLYEWLLLM